MKLEKKFGLIILFIISFILLLNTDSYAGTQTWNSLDYDVTVNSDGSMDVIETWDVYISETNTLFKKFDIGTNNYNITDVKITEVENKEEISLNQIFVEQYYVDPSCYYGLMINDSTFEIAWNVGLDNSSDNRIYKMYYTVENAVKIYNDCTELYWQFLSNENTMIGNNVTGTIRLPNSVSNLEKLRVWGHGDYTAEIRKNSTNEVSFSLNSVKANKMLEVRVVTEENIYPNCINIYNKEYLEEILSEEQVWADEANKEREDAKNAIVAIRIFVAVVIGINIIVLFICLSKRSKYKVIGKELKATYSYPKSDLKYFRDIPDEKNSTPARAAYMYGFKENNSNITEKMSKIFSATMLDLSLKGLIAFETISEKEVRISITSNSSKNDVILTEDESIIYNLLKDAMSRKDYITPKEFSKYASKKYESVYKKLNSIEEIVKEYEIKAGKISEERMEIAKKWNSKFGIYLVFTIISSFFVVLAPALTIGLGILAATCRKNYIYVSILSETGNQEVAEWKGLKKYMEDYSMLDEKLVPDIVLWEKYLVYATTFGISKKVIEQLKAVHPEMFVESTNTGNNINRYAYWHMMTNTNFGDNNFESFSKSLEKVYNSAQSAYNVAHSSSSSGSGGGGGFSGGGGGRRWRWKLRRTLK